MNNLTDKEMLIDVLTTLKSLAGIYHHFSIEASNDFVFDIAYDLQDEILSEQRECYNKLIERGWYKMEKAPANKINQELVKFETARSELDEYYLG